MTIVVTGLQEALEVLPEAEAGKMLDRVHAVVRRHSSSWPETGIVFAMQDGKRFVVRPPSGSVVLSLENGRQVEIGARLWHGAAPGAYQIMATRRDERGRESHIHIGCWLRRVS
jgi:hypothetical protein